MWGRAAGREADVQRAQKASELGSVGGSHWSDLVLETGLGEASARLLGEGRGSQGGS